MVNRCARAAGLLSCLPLPNKITQCFGAFIRDRHCSQISGTMTAGQLQRVSPVRLHPISGLLRNQARRHHRALHTQLRQLPVQYESGRARLIAGTQLLGRTKLLMNLRIESSRLAIVPRLRTSPPGWLPLLQSSRHGHPYPKIVTSLSHDRLLRLWLWTAFVKQTQPNPRLAQRAGHYIMTNGASSRNFRECRQYASPANYPGQLRKNLC